uniref:Transmembrane protein n=1 Tax=Strongyloides venezuelensis TaxID=75913 RepID=A0A0K0FIG1_STRVS
MHTKLFFILLLYICFITIGLCLKPQNELYLNSLHARNINNSEIIVNYNNKSAIIKIELNNKINKTLLNIIAGNRTSFYPEIITTRIRKDDCLKHLETQLNSVDVMMFVIIGLIGFFAIVLCTLRI